MATPFEDLIPTRPAAPAGPIVLGQPRPKLPPAQTPTQAAIDEEQLAALRAKNAKASGTASPTSSTEAKAALAAIKSARENIGWSTTGLAGQVMGNIGGSGAKDLLSQIDTVRANLAFDRLAAMRAASPTGGALGNVTERELSLLQSTLANLDPEQSQKQLRENLDRVELHYLNFLNSLEGRQPVETLDDARRLASGVAALPGDKEPGNPDAITGHRYTPAQLAEFEALIRSKPTPAQLNEFAERAGFGGIANADAIAAAAAKGAAVTDQDYSLVDQAARDAVLAEVAASEGAGIVEPDSSALLQTGMGLGLRDEAAGVGRALSRAVQGRDPVEGYLLGRDAERARAEQARERMGGVGTAIEVGGSLLSANPQGAMAPVVSRINTLMQGGKAGAYGGGVAGFGYGEGLEGSATNALLGAGVGAGVGVGISAIGSRGAQSAARQEGPELLSAANRQEVPINAANIRPGARNALAYLEASPGSAGPVQRNLGAQTQRIEEQAGTLSGNASRLPTDVAGETVRGAGLRFKAHTRAVADKLYKRAEQAAGNTKITAENAVATIRAKIAELSETPSTNQARIDALSDILADLVTPDGQLKSISVKAIRDMRSGVRTRLKSKGLTMTQAEADAAEALSAISDDIATDLAQRAPRAGQLFRRADGYYRERQSVLSELQEVIGGRDGSLSGEKIFSRLQALASPKSGGVSRLETVLRRLEPDEKQSLAATIAESLGRKSPEDPFSAALFASQARNLSPKARELYFGKDGAQTIDDLARLSRSLTAVQGKLNNSRSAQVVNYANNLKSLVLGGGGGALLGGGAPGAIAGSAAVAAGSAGLRNISARIMLSRPVVRWLARAPRSNDPAAIQAHIRQLGGLGRGTPIAADLQALQRQLQQQFAGPVAASDSDRREDR